MALWTSFRKYWILEIPEIPEELGHKSLPLAVVL